MRRNSANFLAFLQGTILAWLGLSAADPAMAINGYTYVSACGCSTTADFVGAAKTVSASNHPAGVGSATATYTLISTTTARSAYIQITGQGVYSVQAHTITWVVTAATPVDSTGTSIASQTESAQESFYGTLDGTLLGMNRSGPLAINVSDTYAASFINSIDEEVGPGIDLALAQLGIPWSGLPLNTPITVKFSDGTTAIYIKTNPSSDHWQWSGIAHNKNNQLINRDGSLRSNPNTAGIGGGSVSVPGFGPGAGLSWLIDGGDQCFASSYVTIDGQEYGSSGWGPC